MKKILLNIPETKSWTGGLNYFLNLARGIQSLPERRFEYYTLSGQTLSPPLDKFNRIVPPWLQNNNILNKVVRRFSRDFLKIDPLTSTLKSNQIALFSHGFLSEKSTRIKSLPWIPDFQHKHLPNFFTAQECQNRNKVFENLAQNSKFVLFSSNDALKDFNHFYPHHRCKTFVLQFVTASFPSISQEDSKIALSHLNIQEPYFYVPNQLWAHKNHSVIIEALRILKEEGKQCPLVFSTGLTEDYRNPNYFSSLKQKVEKYGLQDRMIFLGLVDYSVVSSLMLNSAALINPSFFEGWSTTVEESKSLGKKILLSNIDVHKEQAPARGVFFSPEKPEELATLMLSTIKNFDFHSEKNAIETASNELPLRLKHFGLSYEHIVQEIIG